MVHIYSFNDMNTHLSILFYSGSLLYENRKGIYGTFIFLNGMSKYLLINLLAWSTLIT